ncbi:response regulator [Nubsella zeaxanthinifaciens]|uniref:response regulator n=1 Tax=Nubsella zeaxanthinifaciens TaxID=392412 RepID=UPI003D04DEC2
MAQNSTKQINILLVDDHHLVRDGIKSLLAKYPNFNVIGEAADGLEALEIITHGEHQVDLILADINMPNMGGLELCKKVNEVFPTIRVLILSMLDHEKYISQALQAGAKGYLLKSVNEEELVFAIRQVIYNSFYICTELSYHLLGKLLLGTKIVSRPQNNVPKVEFSSREVEILALIAEGYTNLEIADKLFTSKRTVEGHRLQMINKTGVKNTAALIKYCIVNGVLHYQMD